MTIRDKDKLHKSSPWVFTVSMFIAAISVALILRLSIPEKVSEKKIEIPPVVFLVQNIPETRQQKAAPVPPKPTAPKGSPLEILDSITLDDIKVEEPQSNNTEVNIAPPTVYIPRIDSKEEVKEIFQYFEVEEIPEKIKNIIPEYPEMARRAGIEGTVTLKALVSVKGVVDSVEVIDGPQIFRKPSIQAAKKTTFKPARYNDKAVACWVIMPFRYKIDD